jgi:hypothetical protein
MEGEIQSRSPFTPSVSTRLDATKKIELKGWRTTALTTFSPTPGSSTLIYIAIHPSRLCLYILLRSLIDITQEHFSSVPIDITQKRYKKALRAVAWSELIGNITTSKSHIGPILCFWPGC